MEWLGLLRPEEFTGPEMSSRSRPKKADKGFASPFDNGSSASISAVRKLRCAIYTRKSSEEGLDMDFNSLDAQRESCEAYVISQRAEGWSPVSDRYDDGGFSGGTLERPALKRLLADVKAGKIDVIVVYKIDRLSRSMLDFLNLVELFERHGATFVSVTQSFNTKDAMGRMALNILVTFAQFERELIGERIRDKVAASRNRYITPDVRRDRLCRERDGLPCSAHSGHHGSRHPCNLVDERVRSNLGWATRQQSRKPRPMPPCHGSWHSGSRRVRLP
jgi:site-specific DNA recombinase